jgi:flagellar hook-associated protein 3 FlgL
MDRAAVQKALGLMNDAISGISQLRAHVGAQGKAVDDANSSNQLATVYVQNMVDETESLDLGTAMTSLSQQQLQLQAAYMILSRLSSLSLLNYLK